jgi:hypothetical protein
VDLGLEKDADLVEGQRVGFLGQAVQLRGPEAQEDVAFAVLARAGLEKNRAAIAAASGLPSPRRRSWISRAVMDEARLCSGIGQPAAVRVS